MTAELFADAQRLKQIKYELDSAYCHFNEATVSYDIEAAIFRISALEKEYGGIIHKVKLERICNSEVLPL